MHFIHKIQCFEEFLHKFALIFKNLFFPEFQSIKLFLDQSKLRLKFWSASVCFNRCSIDVGSIEAFLIDRTYFSINQNSYWEFFKIFSFHVIKHYFKNFPNSFSLIRSVKASNQVFCRFPSNFLQGFCHLRPVRPYCPSFFIYFQFSCIFVMHLGIFSNLREIGIFDDSSFFFGNWSLSFCYGTI